MVQRSSRSESLLPEVSSRRRVAPGVSGQEGPGDDDDDPTDRAGDAAPPTRDGHSDGKDIVDSTSCSGYISST